MDLSRKAAMFYGSEYSDLKPANGEFAFVGSLGGLVFAKQLKTYLAITKLQVGVVVNFGMSTLKEGFLRFVNNFTEPQLRASAPLREDNPTATSIANICF